MKSKTDQNIQDIKVEFYEVNSGWIYFKVNLGEQTLLCRFSEVFDPILDFKYWLEAISIGVEQASFKVNAEGCFIVFNLERVSWESEILTISDLDAHPEFTEEDTTRTIKANISRKQVVHAFYWGLLNFSSSDKFKSIEWEVQFIEGTNKKSEIGYNGTCINEFRSQIIEQYLNKA